jgi:hypothetical protein
VDDSSRIFTLSTGPASEDIIGQYKIEKKEKNIDPENAVVLKTAG